MKEYNVKEVARMVGKKPETVRRWIKDGELNAEMPNSRKEGLVIKEDDLRDFLNKNSQYAGIAAGLGLGAAALAVAPAFAALGPVLPILAKLFGGNDRQSDASEDVTVASKNDRRAAVESRIREREQSIKQKTEQITALMQDIKESHELLSQDKFLLENWDNFEDDRREKAKKDFSDLDLEMEGIGQLVEQLIQEEDGRQSDKKAGNKVAADQRMFNEKRLADTIEKRLDSWLSDVDAALEDNDVPEFQKEG